MFGLKQTNESGINHRSDAPLLEMNPVEHTQINWEKIIFIRSFISMHRGEEKDKRERKIPNTLKKGNIWVPDNARDQQRLHGKNTSRIATCILRTHFLLVASLYYKIHEIEAYLTLTALVHLEDIFYQQYLAVELPATAVKVWTFRWVKLWAKVVRKS